MTACIREIYIYYVDRIRCITQMRCILISKKRDLGSKGTVTSEVDIIIRFKIITLVENTRGRQVKLSIEWIYRY